MTSFVRSSPFTLATRLNLYARYGDAGDIARVARLFVFLGRQLRRRSQPAVRHAARGSTGGVEVFCGYVRKGSENRIGPSEVDIAHLF